MAEVEDITEEHDNYIEDNSHQACYVFKSLLEQDDCSDPRPTKKRKVNKTTQNPSALFPLLLNGLEPKDHAQRREQLFAQSWARKGKELDQIANDLNQTILPKFTDFIEKAKDETQNERLPIAILTSNSQSNVQDRFLELWHSNTQPSSGRIMVNLRPSQCSSLQTALKNIIKLSLVQNEDLDYYNEFLNKHKRLIPMNFDLELLQIYVNDNNIQSILISCLDVETFEMSVINDMIAMLHSWSDRLPFIMVVGLATTTDLFESRLPKSTLGLLEAEIFELHLDCDPTYRIFKACQTENDNKVFLGPSTSNVLLEMTENQNMTPQSFIQAIKYVYMSHFFSNPLSVLLDQDHSFEPQGTRALGDAIRHCDSFRTYCEELIAKDKTKRQEVKQLLEDDDLLLKEASRAIQQGQEAFFKSARVISALTELYQTIVAGATSTSTKPNDSAFSIEVQLYQSLPHLTESTIFHSIESALQKSSSTSILENLAKCSTETLETLNIISIPALQILKSSKEDTTHVSTTPTTSTKFKITRHPKSKSPNSASKATHDKAHTALLDDILSTLQSVLYQHSFPPQSGSKTTSSIIPFCSESYIFNLRQPLHTTLIAPRPRHALERALSKPGDYLSCDHGSCNGNANDADAPPSSILYNLFSEAGAIMNVRDMFEAFKARLHAKQVDREDAEAGAGEGEEKRMQALFYSALSDLKYVGLVKASTAGTVTQVKRKKNAKDAAGTGSGEVEVIAKTSWFGL